MYSKNFTEKIQQTFDNKTKYLQLSHLNRYIYSEYFQYINPYLAPWGIDYKVPLGTLSKKLLISQYICHASTYFFPIY